MLTLLSATVLLPLTVQAAVNWGTATPQTYQMTYDADVFGSGTAGSTAFCQKWRIACINYVGARDYHHVVNCGATEKGPTIFNLCAAVQKDEQGNWTGSETPCDFTAEVLSTIGGVTIAGQPSQPYAKCAESGASTSNTDTSNDDSDEANTTSSIPAQQPATTSSPADAPTTEASPTDDAQAATETGTTSTDDDAAAQDSQSVFIASTTITSAFSALPVAAGPSLSGSNNPFVQNNAGDASSSASAIAAPLSLLSLLLGTLAIIR